MRKILKVGLITLLVLLVLFSILADMPIGKTLQNELDLGVYLRIVSIIGLLIALCVAWGYRNKIAASQKYQRANTVLAEAEAAAQKERHNISQMEQRLRASYAAKEQRLDDQIGKIKAGYEQRLKKLQEQNLELKETVAKLMGALKKERSNRR